MSRGWIFVAASLALVLAAGVAFGDTPKDSTASRLFHEGEVAYGDGDFAHAASRFEEAYAAHPHPSALWNAARAWQRAQRLARAANLYAQLLRTHPESEDHVAVVASLSAIDRQLARIDLAEWSEAKVDDEAVLGPIVYVDPGPHVIAGGRGTRTARVEIDVSVGQLKVVPFPPEIRPGAHAAVPSPPASEPSPPGRQGWSPLIVVVGGGLTLVAGGLTVASGIDTESWKSDHYDPDPSEGNLKAGQDRQLRTNALLGATIGLAAVTALVAIVLVDWRSPKGRSALGSYLVRTGF